MTDPKQMNLSGIPMPKRPLSEDEIGKAYLESQILVPELLKSALQQLSDIADSVSVLALYFEKKGIHENLFTETDLAE